MKRRSSLIAAALLAASLCVSAPALARSVAARPSAHPALTHVTLWLDWLPNSDHVGIYVAMARGYYRAAGLEVSAQVPSGAADGLKLVAHGSGDIAISYEPEVLLARSAGIPVEATAAIVQSPLNCVISLRSSGIARPAQLQGKTVGVAGVASDYAALSALVRGDGGDPSRVKTVTVNYSLLQALLSRKVDAVEGVYWTWEALQAEQSGHQVNVMRLDHYGVPSYDELVFATGTRQVRTESATLRAFQRATFQGYAYAVAHPSEATSIMLHVPGVLSTSRALFERSIALLAPVFHDAQGHYGTISAARWQAYANWMASTRPPLLTAKVDARTAVTQALLP